MREYGLKKRERLLSPRDFSRVFKEGKRLHTRSFLVTVRKNGLGVKRLGVSVSSEVGGAVKRNRLKRLIREFFRLNKHEILPERDVDIVVTVKKGAAVKDYAGAGEELKKAFEGLRL